MASKSEIPSNREMEGYVAKVKAPKTTIKDCESYIKTLNKKIAIDKGRAATTEAMGLFGDTVGYLMRSKDRRCLLQGYEAQKTAVTKDLARLKDQWFQTYGLPNG
ncbi:hypothetical protein TorRG33x02_077410 [Trema orientale]|uniref:Uncharacterized protein n=1 Tax=Trema orientale TaxID=63057 RepID=A0A2P5FF95_TREOI|nr:hypothetical protein TorRG33x02_077410 [Trema orientale]